jgi:hypothetical protein
MQPSLKTLDDKLATVHQQACNASKALFAYYYLHIMKLPQSYFLLSAFALLSSTVSCSCRPLLQRINDRRRENGMKDLINPDIFISVMGGDTPECSRTLQVILEYAADKDTAINFCEGEAVCTVAREKIKQVISHALLGNFQEVTQNINYDFLDKTNLFPVYLKNYFADTTHDDHLVTVNMHKLTPSDLNPNAQFQSFLLQTGELGELEDVVPVVTKITNNFVNLLYGTGLEDRVRSRHLDLMLTTLMPSIPADSAVLVSDFQSFSTAAGQPTFSGINRNVLFMDAVVVPPNTFYQYEWVHVLHELTKAKAGFSSVPRDKVIETGFWSSFAPDPKLRLLIQLLAAAETGHRLLFKIPQVPMCRLVELAQFLTDVTDHHPQDVLRALQAFLPRLIQRRVNLDEPASTKEFMDFLSHPDLHQMQADVDDGEKEEDVEIHHQHPSRITYEQLTENSKNFAQNLLTNGFPVKDNLISTLAIDEVKYPKDSIARQAEGVRILIHRRIFKMMEAFLEYKRQHGSSKEKALYREMNVHQLIDRLLQKRPLMFMSRADSTLLPGRFQPSDSYIYPVQQQWFCVGTENEQEPLVLANYLSYDEMELSAFVNVATPTYFINDGNRNNQGKPGVPGSFQPDGIYIAAVGARFEVPGRMERRYLDVKRTPHPEDPMYVAWEQLYDVNSNNAVIVGVLDREGRKLPDIYRHGYAVRMELTLEPIILYANQVAGEKGKKARLRLVGLGIGVWAVNPDQQGAVIVEVVKNIIRSNDLQHIGMVEFSWFPYDAILSGQPLGNVQRNLVDDLANFITWTRISGQFADRQGHTITLEQNQKNPADPINAGELLVAVYAWDSNSFPGNEYWARMLTASGDPAAACCSTIQELQNPFINTSLRADQKLALYGSEGPSGLQLQPQLHQAPQPHSASSNYQQPSPWNQGLSRFSPAPASPPNLSPQPAFLGPRASPNYQGQQPAQNPSRPPPSLNPSRPPPSLNPSRPPPALNPVNPSPPNPNLRPPPLASHPPPLNPGVRPPPNQSQSPHPAYHYQAPQSGYYQGQQPSPQPAYFLSPQSSYHLQGQNPYPQPAYNQSPQPPPVMPSPQQQYPQYPQNQQQQRPW